MDGANDPVPNEAAPAETESPARCDDVVPLPRVLHNVAVMIAVLGYTAVLFYHYPVLGLSTSGAALRLGNALAASLLFVLLLLYMARHQTCRTKMSET